MQGCKTSPISRVAEFVCWHTCEFATCVLDTCMQMRLEPDKGRVRHCREWSGGLLYFVDGFLQEHAAEAGFMATLLCLSGMAGTFVLGVLLDKTRRLK